MFFECLSEHADELRTLPQLPALWRRHRENADERILTFPEFQSDFGMEQGRGWEVRRFATGFIAFSQAREKK